MADQPNIIYEGKKYYQIGCRKCGRGFNFSVFREGNEFLLKCSCGHIVKIDPGNIVHKQD